MEEYYFHKSVDTINLQKKKKNNQGESKVTRNRPQLCKALTCKEHHPPVLETRKSVSSWMSTQTNQQQTHTHTQWLSGLVISGSLPLLFSYLWLAIIWIVFMHCNPPGEQEKVGTGVGSGLMSWRDREAWRLSGEQRDSEYDEWGKTLFLCNFYLSQEKVELQCLQCLFSSKFPHLQWHHTWLLLCITELYPVFGDGTVNCVHRK